MAIEAGETTYYQAKRGIVQDGLVLNLDAAVDQSYNGGTTWRDLAGSNDGTLINGPTFSSDNGGVLSFDNTDDHGIITATFNFTATLCCWFSGRNTTANYLLDFRSSSGTGYLYIETDTNPGVFYTSGTSYVNGIQGDTLNDDDPNPWQHVVISGISINCLRIYIASRFSLQRFLNGKMGMIQIYNRALSANEVAQNYNATRHRFGV